MKQRPERIAAIVQKAVAHSLQKLIPNQHVSINEIKISPDFRHATVWLSSFGADSLDANLLLDAAHSRMPEIRKQLSLDLQTKYLPRISFRYYDAKDRASRVDDLINNL